MSRNSAPLWHKADRYERNPLHAEICVEINPRKGAESTWLTAVPWFIAGLANAWQFVYLRR